MANPKTQTLGLNLIDRSSPTTTYLNLDTNLDQNWQKIDGDTGARQIENIGYGVQSGLETIASATPDMNVHIQSGVVYLPSGKRVQFDAVTIIAVTPADATNPRKDIVFVSSAGAITYLAGTPAAAPAEPALPAGAFKLCVIDVPAADTTIEQAQITDSRGVLKKTSAAHMADTANPHNVTAAQVGALPLSGGTMSGNINMGQKFITNSKSIEILGRSNNSDGLIIAPFNDTDNWLGPAISIFSNKAKTNLTFSVDKVGVISLGTVRIRIGTGSPEGVVTSNVGSLYLRTDGGSGTTLYVKESGTGNTGWIAK